MFLTGPPPNAGEVKGKCSNGEKEKYILLPYPLKLRTEGIINHVVPVFLQYENIGYTNCT